MSLFILLIVSIMSLSCSKDKEDQEDSVTEVPVVASPVSTDRYLNIQVTNIQTIEGNINYALFNNEADFDNKTNWVIADKKDITNDTMLIQIKNVPGGDYAISIYHDKNNNEELDKNLLGIPTEGFGFSNNVMGTFGPPSFEQAKIYVDSTLKNQTTSIALKFF